MRCLPLLAALVVVGCGGSGTRSPCPERVPGVARVVSSSPGLVTCSYRAGADAFRVTIDSAPQAWVRWQRAQVERAQTALEWSHDPSQAPRFVDGVGGGAFWVRAPRELVASDGRRLLTVRVLRPRADDGARQVAVRVAQAGLGPVHLPG